MQISDIAKQYVSANSSSEAMTGTRGIEKLVSSIRDLTAGNIFEGTVNSVKNGQVVIGLSNGTLLNARLDASMQLMQGQSMFFQVKLNNGETIAIRPYTVDGNGVNLTLLNALDAAGLPVTDKNLNLANNMMQEHMPIDKNTLNQMARVLMANPDMSVNTLVQMKKLDIPVTPEMVAQFENYVDDSSAVHKALDSFITELPVTMAGKDMPLEQLKMFDAQLLQIVADGMETTMEGGVQQSVVQTVNPESLGLAEPSVILGESVASELPVGTENQATSGSQVVVEMPVNQEGSSNNPGVPVTPEGQIASEITVNPEGIVGSELGAGLESATVSAIEPDASMNPETGVQQPVSKEVVVQEKAVQLMNQLFGDTGITSEDSAAVVLNKLSHVIMTGEHISKEALSQLFADKDMQQFLRDALQGQMYLTPEEVADGEKVKKLYERLESKTKNLESLLNQAGLQDTPLAKTVTNVRSNVEFMNQINQAYTYVQIPLKMRGQNASGQLYVYTNKREIKDPEKELTAFLHLDLDHLGSTDVSVKMLHKKVDTKFYMDSDEAFELVKAHMPELEERLRLKGFDAKIYVENEGKKVNFLDDFLKKDAPPTGQLHRYSFDVRA